LNRSMQPVRMAYDRTVTESLLVLVSVVCLGCGGGDDTVGEPGAP